MDAGIEPRTESRVSFITATGTLCILYCMCALHIGIRKVKHDLKSYCTLVTQNVAEAGSGSGSGAGFGSGSGSTYLTDYGSTPDPQH